MTTPTQINYYVFDSITKDDDNQYWGYLNGQSVEVFPTDTDTDDDLIKKGFAKCDALGTETYLVEENAWATLAPERFTRGEE